MDLTQDVKEPTILVVDDDETFRMRFSRAFRDRGYEVYESADVDEALAAANRFRPAAVIVDLRLPGGSGLSLVASLKATLPDIHVIVLTGYGSIATALEAVRIGAKNYLTKPTDVDAVLRALQPGGEKPAAQRAISTPSLSRVEWEHIQRVLADCDGNISKAAEVLGIHRRSLQRKLAKLPQD